MHLTEAVDVTSFWKWQGFISIVTVLILEKFHPLANRLFFLLARIAFMC